MSFQTSIQTIAGAHVEQGSPVQCAVDWLNGYVYTGWSSGGTPYFAKSRISDGSAVSSAAFSTMENADCSVACPGVGIDADGQLYCKSSIGMSRIDPSDWSRNDTWGGVPYGLFPPGPPTSTQTNNALQGPVVVITSGGGTKYIVGCGVGGSFTDMSTWYVCQLPDFAGMRYDWGQQASIYGCAGAALSGNGYFAVSKDDQSDVKLLKLHIDDTSWVPADWPTPNSGMANSTLATITAAGLGWSGVRAYGVCLDQTDGNPMVFVQNGSSPNQAALIKVDKSGGGVLWTATLGSGGPHPGQQMSMSRVLNQQWGYVRGGALDLVDTSDGSVATTTLLMGGVTTIHCQAYDDGLGAVVAGITWSGGYPDPPTPLNGSTSGFTGWSVFYVSPGASPTPGGTLSWMAAIRPIKTNIW